MRVIFPGIVALVVLVGCVTVNETYTGVSNASKRDYLNYVGGNGPILITAVNVPFSEGVDQAMEVAARLASQSIAHNTVKFTVEKAKAHQPHFRVVMVFDLPAATSDYEICNADTRGAPVERISGEMRIFSVFCARGELLSGTRVRGPAPKTAADAGYEKIVRAAFENMFPYNDTEGSNEYPIRGRR